MQHECLTGHRLTQGRHRRESRTCSGLPCSFWWPFRPGKSTAGLYTCFQLTHPAALRVMSMQPHPLRAKAATATPVTSFSSSSGQIYSPISSPKAMSPLTALLSPSPPCPTLNAPSASCSSNTPKKTSPLPASNREKKSTSRWT